MSDVLKAMRNRPVRESAYVCLELDIIYRIPSDSCSLSWCWRLDMVRPMSYG